MRITDLIYLIELSHSKSIRLSSEKMHITQQGLSQVILRLEQELDTPLLDRSRQGITLTDAGQIAVSKSLEIIQKYDELKMALEELKYTQEQSMEGDLTLSHSHVSGTIILPKVLKLFKKRYPNVHLKTREYCPIETIEWIKEDPTGVGLINYPESQEKDQLNYLLTSPDLVYKEVLRDELILCIPRSWNLSEEQLKDVNYILQLPIVYYCTQQYEEIVEQIFSDANIAPNIFLRTLNTELYRQTIIDGLAMGIFSAMELNENQLLKNRSIQTNLRLKLVYTWVTSAKQPISFPAQKFFECLKAAVKTVDS